MKKLDRYEFIWKAIQKHGYKYDYRKVEYINLLTKVCIICPIHGEFWQRPENHIRLKQGCPICTNNIKLTTEKFIEKAKLVHDDKYDYSKVKYINSLTKVCIICPIHGEFWQVAVEHLQNYGCKKCGNVYSPTTDEFIEKSKEAHGDKYDYSKVEYVGNKFKVCIICPIHGEFYQTPNSHLRGKGCPSCNESHLEKETAQLLDGNDIAYERQKRFKWLGKQSLDFYLPDYRIGIECQGKQHFAPFSFGSKKKNAAEVSYQECVERDKRKLKLCVENGIKLLHYSNLGIEYPYDVIEDKNILLEKIK